MPSVAMATTVAMASPAARTSVPILVLRMVSSHLAPSSSRVRMARWRRLDVAMSTWIHWAPHFLWRASAAHPSPQGVTPAQNDVEGADARAADVASIAGETAATPGGTAFASASAPRLLLFCRPKVERWPVLQGKADSQKKLICWWCCSFFQEPRWKGGARLIGRQARHLRDVAMS